MHFLQEINIHLILNIPNFQFLGGFNKYLILGCPPPFSPGRIKIPNYASKCYKILDSIGNQTSGIMTCSGEEVWYLSDFQSTGQAELGPKL